MKYKPIFIAVAILFAFLSFSSCNSAGGGGSEEEKFVEQFYEAFNIEDFVKIKLLTHTQIADAVYELVQDHYEKYGKVETFTQYKSDSFSNDENTGVTLFYKCKYENESENIFVKFVLIEVDDEYKIANFTFNKNQDYIENIEEYYQDAKKVGITFYEYLINDNLKDISTLLDRETLIDGDYEEDFFEYKST